MLFMRYRKDGGPKSHVHALFVIEIKWLFTIAVLRFGDGSRDAYHTHAFNAVSWLLSGYLKEYTIKPEGAMVRRYWPSLWPIWTPRSRLHQVISYGVSWAITFRGPWRDSWEEINEDRRRVLLTYGRKEVV